MAEVAVVANAAVRARAENFMVLIIIDKGWICEARLRIYPMPPKLPLVGLLPCIFGFLQRSSRYLF